MPPKRPSVSARRPYPLTRRWLEKEVGAAWRSLPRHRLRCRRRGRRAQPGGRYPL